MTKNDLTGLVFGRLTAIEYIGHTVSTTGRRLCSAWRCKCECGTEVKVEASRLLSGNTRSCSCYRHDRASQAKLIDLSGRRFGRLYVFRRDSPFGVLQIKWLCVCDCGRFLRVAGMSLRSGASTCCGKGVCRTWARKGPAAPNWNHALTYEERNNRRKTPEYLAWSREAFEKSGWTCEKCRRRGGKLAVHHKDGWNWCRQRRFDPSNAAVLCRSCHETFHNHYGRGNNTEAQYSEFLLQSV